MFRRSQPNTKNYKQLSKFGSRRGGLPQGKVHQSVQCQMVNSKTIHTSKSIWTQPVMFRIICAYINICMQEQLMKREMLHLKEIREGYMESLEGGKRRDDYSIIKIQSEDKTTSKKE